MNKKIALFSVALIVMLPLVAVRAETNNNTNQNEWRNRWEGQGRPAEGQKGPGRGPDGAGPRPNGQGMGAEPNGMGPDQRPDGARRGNFNSNDNKAPKQFAHMRCEMIQNRINSFNNENTPFQNIYDNINTRLNRLIDRLDSKGIDTAQLKSYLETLNGKISTLESDYKKFVEQLKNINGTACNQNQNDNSQTFPDLSSIRNSGEQVRKDRQDIRDYFRNTIQPELQKIREQLKDDNSNNNS